MALNGSVSVEATRSGNDDLVFSWEAVQDQNTMTSTVSWKMELVAHAYGRIDQGTPQPWTVTIDGQTFSGTASVNIANNETKELASGQIVLTHNEDGTRSFAFTFGQELNITWGASSGNPIYIGAVTGEGIGELDPLEAPEPEKFPIKKWLAGLIAALCSPRRAFLQPERDPIGYLYGHVAKEGETPTHIINGVDYVGVLAPDIFSVYTPEIQKICPYIAVHKNVESGKYVIDATFPKAAYRNRNGEEVVDYTGCSIYSNYRFPYDPSNDSKWRKLEDKTGVLVSTICVNTEGLQINELIWSNYNVMDEDGNIVLAACDPIPIYE